MVAVIKWLIIAIFLTITQMQFFVVEREVIVANLRITKLLSLCVFSRNSMYSTYPGGPDL